jgi:hypothetical protein
MDLRVADEFGEGVRGDAGRERHEERLVHDPTVGLRPRAVGRSEIR